MISFYILRKMLYNLFLFETYTDRYRKNIIQIDYIHPYHNLYLSLEFYNIVKFLLQNEFTI